MVALKCTVNLSNLSSFCFLFRECPGLRSFVTTYWFCPRFLCQTVVMGIVFSCESHSQDSCPIMAGLAWPYSSFCLIPPSLFPVPVLFQTSSPIYHIQLSLLFCITWKNATHVSLWNRHCIPASVLVGGRMLGVGSWAVEQPASANLPLPHNMGWEFSTYFFNCW